MNQNKCAASNYGLRKYGVGCDCPNIESCNNIQRQVAILDHMWAYIQELAIQKT